MNLSIKSISENWKLEAKLENNQKYFYNYEEVDKIINNDKCYVIGRKGSGKSAICEHIVKMQRDNTYSVKLSFKNFPFNELYSLDNQKYTSPNQYITLWKYLIYSHVCKLMIKNDSIHFGIRSELEKLYPASSTNNLSRTISKWTSFEFGANFFGQGGSLKIGKENLKNENDWIEKTNILEDIILEYCDQSLYFIVFDELDEDYRNVKDDSSPESYIFLLTSLFKAV